MDLHGSGPIEQALRRVGQLLDSDGHGYAIVILGGAALNLLGIIDRPTSDVDILAFAETTGRRRPKLSEPPEPIPEPLRRAIRTVARDMGLDADWLNTAPAVQWRAGLPPGLAAAGWVATQDASPDFARVLDKALDHIRHDLHLDDHSGPRRGR